jgi:hypothetical protein
MSLFTVDLSGLKNLDKYIRASPDAVNGALRDTINGGIKFAYAESSRQIRAEVNLTQDYIGSVAQGKALKITQYASPDKLLALISANQRPTSLARFARGGAVGTKGVSVEVKPGQSREMKSAFLMRLRQGQNAVSDDAFNLGLAIRLKPGQTIFNKSKVLPFSSKDKSLYLLYGPSVDQVFQQARAKIEAVVTRWVEVEFSRQIARHMS